MTAARAVQVDVIAQSVAVAAAQSCSQGDLALLKLASPVSVAPARLGEQDPPTGATNHIDGWGRTSCDGTASAQLKRASVRVTGRAADAYNGPALASTGISGYAWKGDSGGPQRYNDAIVGVASTADCASRQYYASVTSGLAWIRRHIGGSGPDPEPGHRFENADNVTIPDLGSAVSSPITVFGITGNAPSALKVAVDIKHTFRGDLRIDLVAPDGSVCLLKNSSTSDSADNIIATYTVNASSEAANGTWNLRARDTYRNDVGYIDAWSLEFSPARGRAT
ncbi:proprotein convertase P-domain-containing protein [Actinokineospora guangxiensis]|uniref:Proprotein convertase P-domain-containing protein n=1 Tax=Actinokineospora guangxiensis TaxID=1490288 RepID=A0ABW0EYK1_9PSEU